MRRMKQPTAFAIAAGSAVILAAAIGPRAWGHDPVEGGRLGQATLLRVAARDPGIPAAQRIGPILDLLRLELDDPTPDQGPSSSYCTVSEAVQMRLMAGLHEAGDVGALDAALERVGATSRVGKRILVAMARGLPDDAPPWVVATVAASVAHILLEDPEDVLRWSAAESLGDLGIAHPEVAADVVPALEAALRDPCRRTWLPDAGFGEDGRPQVRAVVALSARGALARLGYEVVNGRARKKEGYAPGARPSRPALPSGAAYVREILERWGYKVSVNGAEGVITAAGTDGSTFAVRVRSESGRARTRGGRDGEVAWALAREVLARAGYNLSWSGATQTLYAERPGRSIRVQAGSRTALVDGNPVQMWVAPRIREGRLQIPKSFVQKVAAR